MVTLATHPIGQRLTFPPLPPHPRPEELLADALPILDPPSRMSVTDAAERSVRIEMRGGWDPYDRRITPYMVEPADMTTSRRFKAVIVTGPSQCGKTAMLQTSCLHRVRCDPMPVLIVHMDRPSRDRWVENTLDPMIRNSPEIAELLGRSRDDSTFSRKRFRGMRVEIGYPTPQQLSSAKYGLVVMTDFDHFPVVLGPKDSPESTPYRMARQRIRTFLSRGCVLVESTPAHPWADPSWRPDKATPHMLPPASAGIVNLYNDGTRGRWYWECPDCADAFEPTFAQLVFDRALDPGAAGDGAMMACPHCGCLVAHRHKVEMNRRALDRRGWLHEGQRLLEDGSRELLPITDSGVRETDAASYAIDGAAAAFSNWREMVANLVAAERKAEELGDETDLSGVWYTEIGKPYRPRHMDQEGELGLQFLRDHAQDCPRGVAPEWTRLILVSVDVQDNRFPVAVTAFGEKGRAQIIDRFDIGAPPEGAPNVDDDPAQRRTIQPPRYAEDWAALLPLGAKVWEVQGQGYALTAHGIVIDFQGSPGVSDNAEAFWKVRKKEGQGARWFLSRGHGGWKVPRRVWYETPERGSKGKKARAVKLLNIATDRLKDTIAAALAKSEGDAIGALYAGAWLSDEHRGELVSEVRGAKGWDKRTPQVRNETLDLSAQARALAEHFGILTVTWDHPPPWAEGGPGNLRAVQLDVQGEPEEASAPKRAARTNRTARQGIAWLNGG